jgi:hypothetical protein
VNFDLIIKNMQDITENNDLNQWGQAILRAKTTLIKPQSKVQDK